MATLICTCYSFGPIQYSTHTVTCCFSEFSSESTPNQHAHVTFTHALEFTPNQHACGQYSMACVAALSKQYCTREYKNRTSRYNIITFANRISWPLLNYRV